VRERELNELCCAMSAELSYDSVSNVCGHELELPCESVWAGRAVPDEK
jgi:hypothetical protein